MTEYFGTMSMKDLKTGKIMVRKDATINRNLSVANDATVTGTLTANKIVANTIELPLAIPPLSAEEIRKNNAYNIKVQAAYNQYIRPLQTQTTNGDEETLTPPYIGNYSKGMHHNNLGEVVPSDYNLLVHAVTTGEPSDYDAIPVDGTYVRYHSPQACEAYDLEGADMHAISIIPPPAFSSRWQAADIVENYWMALLRDVNFEDYATSPLAAAACVELNSFGNDYKGPKPVTPANLFRGNYTGDNVGPYISQFLYLPCPFGATDIDQKMHTPVANIDFMTSWSDYLSIQRGNAPGNSLTFDPSKRYIRNGRDLSQWVHMDVLYQAYFQAMLVLGSIGAPLNPGNPYKNSTNQLGFATFGGPHIAALLAEVCSRAIKAAWHQKWNVHRRLRPENMAARVHQNKSGNTNYPIHSDLLNSDAIDRVHTQFGTWLLPQAFPEGCPFHPSYAAGHSTVSGACVTILKAWFDGSWVIPNPKKPSSDGLSLVNASSTLTVEGELNKISSNVGIGRNHAGVHYRSDSDASALLGEEIAISILRDQKNIFNENFAGFTFKKFDGTTITV